MDSDSIGRQPDLWRLAALGWSLIPCGRNKKPLIPSWKRYQTSSPAIEQLRDWDETLKPAAWAVITGAVSELVGLDFDGERGQETLIKLGLNPHVRSGSGGHHVYPTHPGWRVPTWNCKTNRALGNRWPGLDIKGDGGYLLCLGRSQYGEYQWLREPVPDSFNLLPAELREFLGQSHGASPARWRNREGATSDSGRVAPSLLMERAFEQIPGNGRNNAGFWLATQLRDNNYSECEAESVMLEYAARVPGVNLHGEPEAYTRQEALCSLVQAFAWQPREPWGISRARKVPKEQSNMPSSGPGVDFFERKPEPLQEIIEGILREKQLVAFAGPFTVGKSPLLADIIVHRVHGIPWCGHKIRAGPVIIIDLENERGAWSKNVRNIARRLDVRPPKVPEEIEVYLLNDDPTEPATCQLLDACQTKTFDARFQLLEDALRRKPDALVVIDPVDVLFPIKKTENTQVLALFRKLKQLLSGSPHAAIILTFNLRKQDRRARRANLLSAPRDWLEEIAGSLDLCNRSDVRIGMDFHDEAEGVRVINGVRRNEEMRPLLIRPIALGDDPENLAGFEPAPVDNIGLLAVLTPQQLAYWRKLPREWRFDEVADKVVPRATLSRIIRRVGSLALEQKNGFYRKIVD